MVYVNKPNMVYLKRKEEPVFYNFAGRTKPKAVPLEPLFKNEDEKIRCIEYFISEYKHRIYLREEYKKNTIDLDNYFKKR